MVLGPLDTYRRSFHDGLWLCSIIVVDFAWLGYTSVFALIYMSSITYPPSQFFCFVLSNVSSESFRVLS